MTRIKVVPFPVKEEHDSLPFSMYSEYFEAIVSDNANYVDALLTKIDTTERLRLVNSEFDFVCVECPLFRREIERGEVPIVLPLHIAVTNNSINVATVLLKHGADVLKIDSRQNNLLHACVITAFYSPDSEKDICETLQELTKNWSPYKINELMIQENKDKFRPLESAAQQGTLDVMKFLYVFMGEKYRTRTEHNGMVTYTWNDITEYESPGRHSRSPIVLFTYLERAKALEALSHILDCPLFGVWIRAKVRINAIPMAIWALLRAVFVLTYFTVDRNDYYITQYVKDMKDVGYNVSMPCLTHMVTIQGKTSNALWAFLFIYATISILFDIIETINMVVSKEYTKMKNLRGWKNLLVKLVFYRICTLIVSVSIFLGAILWMSLNESDLMKESVAVTLTTFRICVPVCAAWSLMYFLQMLPYLGKSIVAIQGMLVDMANFMVLWCLMLIPFVHTFNIYVNNYSQEGCIKDFDGLSNTLYTVFRMMINLVDITQYNVHYKYFLYLLHMLFVFKVAIILINFLIAIMSESASRTAEHHLIIEWLNSLSIAVTIQERFGSWLLRPYYNFMMSRIFTKDHNGRICIVTQTNRKNDLKELYKIKQWTEQARTK